MKLNRTFVAFCLALLMVNASFGASYTWSGKGGDHLWANALNWIPTNGPPTSGDTVSINAYQVELDETLTLAGMNLSSTIVTGTGGLALGGPSTLAYATFNNASLTINANTDINPGPGADVETSIGCPMVNSATVTVHTGAQFIVSSGTTAINNGTWAFDSQSSLVVPVGSNQVSFVNQGSLYFTNASLERPSGYSSIVSNAAGGTIYSAQTNLMNGIIASAGTIQTASNSIFEITDEAGLALYSGANITGPGITLVSHSCSVSGNVTVSGGLQLNSDGANTTEGMTINGALEIGANGRFYWEGGALAGVGTNITGTIEVDQQGVLYIVNDQNGLILENVILTNNGSVVWTNNGTLYMANGAVIANQLNFYILGDSILRPGLNDTSSVLFTNGGLVIKTGGSTNSAQTAIRVPFYDGGSVHVAQGNIYFYNGGAINNWIVDTGCLVNIYSGTFTSAANANFNASGAIDFSGGALINVPMSGTLNIAGTFNHNGGTFYGSGQVAIVPGFSEGVYQWNAGTISITNAAAALRINSGAYMYIEGANNFKGLAWGTLVNEGLIFWTNDNSSGGITLGNLAVISNKAGFYMECDAYLNDGSSSTNARPVFYNTYGSIVAKTARTGSTIVLVRFNDAGNIFANAGTIELAQFVDNYPGGALPIIVLSGGKVQFDPALVLHANISGTGQITAQKPLTLSGGKMTVTAITLAGNVTNDEVIDLSNFGVLTAYGGPFTQTANGRLIFTLQSTNAGGYSKLVGPTANVILGGGIQGSLVFGGAPPVGTSFPVVTSYQLFNTFSNVSLPEDMTVVYTGNTASIVVTNIPPAVLQGYALNQTNFGLSLATVSNEVYGVQYTTNAPPIWHDLTNFTAESMNFFLSVPIETNTVEFFRVKGAK